VSPARPDWPDRLETDRLLLRPLEKADLPVLVRELGRWEVARWLIRVPHPYTPEDAATWLAMTISGRREGTMLHFVAVPKDDPSAELLGAAGLMPGARERGAAELGYWLRQDAWGRGYGTEMAAAMVRCAFRDMDLGAVTAATDLENDASHAVLLKAGLRQTGIDPQHPRYLRGDPAPARLYRLTRAEWDSAR